jgi:hypothetical protein
LNEWKVAVEEKAQRVCEFLRTGEGIKSERRRILVKTALENNSRTKDIILFCIADFLLEMPPKWSGKWTLTLQKMKAAMGGKCRVTDIGRDSTNFVDTCLDQSVAVQALAHMFDIEGEVRVTKGGHAYWKEKTGEKDDENGSIVDLSYNRETTRGLFVEKKLYESVTTALRI